MVPRERGTEVAQRLEDQGKCEMPFKKYRLTGQPEQRLAQQQDPQQLKRRAHLGVKQDKTTAALQKC
jgi:hypothetical protein